MRFVQDLRFSSGGSLNNMALQDMVGGVTQLILDHQVGLKAKLSDLSHDHRWQKYTHPLLK